MKKKTIVIVSVDAGSGHVQAAKALKAYAEQNNETRTVVHVDLIDYISMPTRKLLFESYGLLAREIPGLWSFVYQRTDSPRIRKVFDQFVNVLQRIDAKPFFRAIAAHNPDYILSTHFTPALLFARFAPETLQTTPRGTLVTDFAMHELWFTGTEQDYFVATEQIAWKLAARDVASNQIHAHGIPADPQFYVEKDRKALRQSYGIPKGQRVITLLSGGDGFARIDAIADELCATSELPTTLYAIAGNNVKLKRKLEAIIPPPHIDLHVYGWVDTIDEYMRIADVLVGKPGGMTTTECLALGTPLIIIDPVPGQEEYNAEYLLSRNMGVIAHTLDDVIYHVAHPPQQQPPQHTNPASLILQHIT